jgi:hypothetical protein
MKTEYQAQIYKNGEFDDCTDNFPTYKQATTAGRSLLKTLVPGSYAIIMKLEPLSFIENVMVHRTRKLGRRTGRGS